MCAEAQTFTDRLQQRKAGKGNVTLHQDKQIEKLVNGRYSDARAAGMRPDAKSEKPVKKEQDKPAKQPTPPPTTQYQDVAEQDSEPDMSKKVMRKSYKITGYRVQVWAGGNSREDRRKAEGAGMTIKRDLPDEPVYVHFYSPRWICRIGNYRTYEEAHAILQQVKKLGYKEAVIVKGKITVQY